MSAIERAGGGGTPLKPGCECTYYPEKNSVDDNRHFAAKVVGFTKSGLAQIVYQVLGDDGQVRTVRGAVKPARLLVGQAEIEGDRCPGR